MPSYSSALLAVRNQGRLCLPLCIPALQTPHHQNAMSFCQPRTFPLRCPWTSWEWLLFPHVDFQRTLNLTKSGASTDLDPRQLCPSTGESPSKGGTLDHLVYIPRTQPLCSLYWVLKASAGSRRQTLTGVSSLGFSVLTPRYHRLTPKSIVLPFKKGQA